MRISIDKVMTYVPKWRGNRDLPEEEQISVVYDLLTCAEEERYSKLHPIYRGGEMEMEYTTNANEIWDLKVRKVNGLFDDKGNEITDPKKVREIGGVYELITEVVAEVKKGIPEQERKNFE